jgi:outer membrane receptor protein involved in Fe transport
LEWHASGRAGFLWRPRHSQSWFANAGRFYHLPGLVDRYGGRWGMVANPDLRPEQGLNAEAGFRRRWKSGFLELCLFRNQITDAILYLRSANLAKPFNLDAALAQGAELSLDQSLPLGLGFSYAATVQGTENQSRTYYRGLALPDEPVYHHTWKTRAALPWRLGLEYAWDFRTDVFRDPGNLQRIPSQHLHHLLFRLGPVQGLRLLFSVQNLTDTYYENVYSAYPYPGRVFHATLTANL